MKKTQKTALTAAAFAAAINITACGSSTETNPSAEKETLSQISYSAGYNPENDELYGVYGPPIAYEEETTAEKTTEYDPQEEWAAPVYGPPICGPGDINGDYVVDSFDLALMRQTLNENKELGGFELYQHDVNQDGKFDANDLNAMKRCLLGDKDEYIPDVPSPSTVPDEKPETTATYDPEDDMPQPVYGPPEWFNE